MQNFLISASLENLHIVHSIHTIYTALYGVVCCSKHNLCLCNVMLHCLRMFVDHYCITLFSYEHPTSAIFPHVSWNALQPVGFVSLHELLSRCHRGRRPADQVLLLLSRLSFTAHENWRLFRSVWSSEGLWSVLFQKSLELSHDRLLNFEPLPVGEAWMVLNCVERTQLRCFDFTQATRIQPCYQAAKESMTACSSAKRLKDKY